MAVLVVEPHLEPMVHSLERYLAVTLVCWCCGYSGPSGVTLPVGQGLAAAEGPQPMLAHAQFADHRTEVLPLAPLGLEELPVPLDSRRALPGRPGEGPRGAHGGPTGGPAGVSKGGGGVKVSARPWAYS